MGGKYITEKERYQIEGFLKAGLKPKEIANLVNKSIRTIYYEISRGKCVQKDSEYREKTIYLADVAQRKYNENKVNKGAGVKIGNDYAFCQYIEKMIGEYHYSPYAALQSIKNNGLLFKTNICTTTLYHYIDKGIFLSITNKSLPMKKRANKKAEKRKVSLNNIKGTSIEERPKYIKNREEYGHWEMDTVVGSKNGKQCLLVLTERMSRKEIIIKIPDKKGISVKKALDRIERKIGTKNFRKTFKTITCDNGCEFLNFAELEKGVWNKYKPRTKIYYCHPYSAYERGTNENQNIIIRRFIPKGTDIETIDEENIEYIKDWMNNYPRKILGGLSANMIEGLHSKRIAL